MTPAERDPVRFRLVLATVWDVQERQRFPDHPRLRVRFDDAMPESRALGWACEIAEAVVDALDGRGDRTAG